MSPTARSRPQDTVRLVAGAEPDVDSPISPRSVPLSVLVSLPVVGYFYWYWHATRDCARLLDQDIDPWAWLCMVFPGMILVIPYMYAQAKLVARIETATREPLGTGTYFVLVMAGVLVPALFPLTLQPRLNRAARIDVDELRSLPIPA
jgi:hypothetical protein